MIRCGKDGAVLTCCHVLNEGKPPEVLPIVGDNGEPVETGEESYTCAECTSAHINRKNDNIPDELVVVHKEHLEKIEKVEWWK